MRIETTLDQLYEARTKLETIIRGLELAGGSFRCPACRLVENLGRVRRDSKCVAGLSSRKQQELLRLAGLVCTQAARYSRGRKPPARSRSSANNRRLLTGSKLVLLRKPAGGVKQLKKEYA